MVVLLLKRGQRRAHTHIRTGAVGPSARATSEEKNSGGGAYLGGRGPSSQAVYRFPSNPNAGGKLLVHAYYSTASRRYERFVALEEAPGSYSYDESRFRPLFQYDYLYCGSLLYDNLSASRMHEWVAYHAHFFGPRSW